MTSLFPGSSPLRSNRSVLNVSNGGPRLTLKVNVLVDNFLCKGQLNKVEAPDLGRSNQQVICNNTARL